ncbi:hypothetical protein L6164_020753 [Bauhinia variegata]|uniref:Uncharacterized protein n=1 Tax=Bauhinia variegata TaxID=167791 RepID=A0ACB9MZJ1_BAUVA|nr:hypothetical protein L6164_020753 [Bauhinia variegata]
METKEAEEIGHNKSVQMHFFDILQQDQKQEEAPSKAKGTATDDEENTEESELVSLSLGLTSNDLSPSKEGKKNRNGEGKNLDEGLALGLDIRFKPSSAEVEAANMPSPASSFEEEVKELQEPTEIWPPSKVLQTLRTGDNNIEASPQNQLKKTRVSIRARCDTQTMNDGCHWRKYGQKIAKGNPCPRAYYRCTVSPTCPVRKQVQRCAEDMSILITTYEGTHNHPLPLSATAMASTTSAAASMLQSPSLTSQPGLIVNSMAAPIISSTTANNLNFTSQISRPQQCHFPNSSISTSNSHPTITLDLTAPPPTSSRFGRFTSMPRYSSSSTSLSFSSSSFSGLQPNIPQSPWSTPAGYFNYGNQLTHNGNQSLSLLNTGKQPLFQSHYIHQPNYMSTTSHGISHQQPLPETIAAATNAITRDPKFQSALAAALTTYVSNGAAGGRVSETPALNMKLGDDMSYRKSTVYASGPKGTNFESPRQLNLSSSSVNAQQGNLVLFPTSLPSPQASKSASGSSSNRSNQLLQ